MKKAVSICAVLILLLYVLPLQAELPFWVEGSAILAIDDPLGLGIQGSVLFDVVKNMQIRAAIVHLNLLNGVTLHLGTDLHLNALLHFSGEGKYKLYGVGGFGLFTGEGFTNFNVEAGIGAMMATTRKAMIPFLEAMVALNSTSGDGWSNSAFRILVRTGVRVR